ncbi:nicotinate-nucleotide adenylyltransferase [Aureimonas jatrophae]|uniref:Probable nicotinate-nucleotide adenylyltransferase n=1 Tax=Aureimonas jatrophae TaxID=1166073 RepID=A0A1H0C1F7_9HYPH|nr:nicotinate-nucleotide adenylyltransferase [Aureimonas jatrophae]SDN51744.1 nicotinate-nucleotide adenylyltransferase [Aureimonas jatrophae]
MRRPLAPLAPAAPATAEELRLPPSGPGWRVGLFGGSFDPPHEGHLLVAETVLQRLRLDRLWWMVTPGNPLKDHGRLRPLAERLRLSQDLCDDPRIVVTGFEASWRVRYSADTVLMLRRRRPTTQFVWVMGADSLASFHRWQDWRRIASAMPIAVVDRPGSTLSLLSSPAARALKPHRLLERDAARLAQADPPAWVFLHGPRSAQSSTRLRALAEPTS